MKRASDGLSITKPVRTKARAWRNFLEKEKDRYREQLERYARLMMQRDSRPIRLGLYFPLLGEWLEWGAPVVLRKQALLFEL